VGHPNEISFTAFISRMGFEFAPKPPSRVATLLTAVVSRLVAFHLEFRKWLGPSASIDKSTRSGAIKIGHFSELGPLYLRSTANVIHDQVAIITPKSRCNCATGQRFFENVACRDSPKFKSYKQPRKFVWPRQYLTLSLPPDPWGSERIKAPRHFVTSRPFHFVSQTNEVVLWPNLKPVI